MSVTDHGLEALRKAAAQVTPGVTTEYKLRVYSDAASPVVVSPVPSSGRNKVEILRNDHGAVNITTGAYVELIASTSATINHIQIFDSSGSVLKLAIGAAASESDKMYIFPGGNGPTDLAIPAGSRISIRAVDADATGGQILINCFS